MAYELMLLADPGTERETVLRILGNAPDITVDSSVENRFLLSVNSGKAQVNIGTKDPIESVHLELEGDDLPLREAFAHRALSLAAELDMRVEDILWGHEVTAESLPKLVAHWHAGTRRPAVTAGAAKPWWRVW